MNEMIERATRANYESSVTPSRKPDWDDLPEPMRENWRAPTRVIVTAMREPLEWMVLMADRKAEELLGNREGNLDPRTIWQTMIDEILK